MLSNLFSRSLPLPSDLGLRCRFAAAMIAALTISFLPHIAEWQLVFRFAHAAIHNNSSIVLVLPPPDVG